MRGDIEAETERAFLSGDGTGDLVGVVVSDLTRLSRGGDGMARFSPFPADAGADPNAAASLLEGARLALPPLLIPKAAASAPDPELREPILSWQWGPVASARSPQQSSVYVCCPRAMRGTTSSAWL